MKNIFKIILILCLGIFVAAGCADDSGGGGTNTENTGGDNTGDGDNNGGDNDTPEFTKLISAEGLSYGETADGKRYVWGKEADGLIGKWGIIATPVEVDFTINKIIVDGYTVYVSTDAGLYAWGNNKYGQVGNGTTDYVLTAYKVEGIDGNIKEIITTGSTVYVLTENGLYAWGDNEYGQVGNGNTDNVLTPYKAVAGNIKEFRVSGSSSYATYYALTEDGLYVWGDNEDGEVGNGTTENVTKPYKTVDGNIKEFIISGSGSIATYYALTDTGLYAWGYNGSGQVGNGTTEEHVTKPHKVEGITGNIKEVISNRSTVYVLTDKGLYAWGYNGHGQVGNGTTENVPKPHKVEGIDGTIKEIIIGTENTVYVLTENGALYAWGYNYYGQVGNEITEEVTKPHKVEGIDGNINEVINHYDTVYVLTENGALYAWGNNEYDQVYNGTTKKVTKPHKVEGIDGNIKEFRVVSGYSLSSDRYATYYALTADGLYAWGNNAYGQVGNGTTEKVLKPNKAVAGNINEFRVLGSGRYATYYALTDDGLYAWGYNGGGQVGNGTTEEHVTKPHKVEGITGNIKEVISYYDTVYVLTDKGLYAWGDNEYGQVGNGTTEKVLKPNKAVAGNIKEFIISNYKEYSSNYYTYYALMEDGSLYAWGDNKYGQVGNGESGYEKDEDGNDDYDKPKKVLTPNEVKIKQN